jgi:hypothetical protein
MTKYNIPLTYKPKIPMVLSGECTQTIRAGRKFQVGDLISFHGWEGRPYRSKWSFRTPYFEARSVYPIKIFQTGIMAEIDIDIQTWNLPLLDIISYEDGIDPPTGEELGRVLTSYHKIPEEGLPAQIIRWKWSG